MTDFSVQNNTAEQLYEQYKNLPSLWFAFGGEVGAVKILTKICDKMTIEFGEIIKDENNYLIEFENANNEINNLYDDYQERIKKLQQEIAALEYKVDHGTATEEEKEELEAKKSKLTTLVQTENSDIQNRQSETQNKTQNFLEKFQSKKEKAIDYGNTTIEKGTPLANTEVKNGFFRRLFGTTGKDKKRAGEEAVTAGNNLLKKVDHAVEIEKEFTLKNRKKK